MTMAARLRILIADDEPDLLDLLKINLEIEGHDVRPACDGTQALEMIRDFCPDLVILDVTMPGMDGLEVVRAIRSEPGNDGLPVVLLSGRGSDPEIFEGWRSGASYYLTKPFQMEELLEFIGGIRVRPRDDECMDEPDMALGETDVPVPAGPAIFVPAPQRSAEEREQLEVDLHGALAGGQFFLDYQPSFDLQNVSVTGVEALIRWRHPVLGTMQPLDFIPTLERTGLMIDVGRWVLEDACCQAARWCEQGYQLILSVNVSDGQFASDKLVNDTRDALTRSRLDPGVLMLDVPETAVTADALDSGRRLRALKTLGVRIAIDDFGRKREPPSYLKGLAVDTLKTDRSLMSGIVDSPESAALMHANIQVAKLLGLEILAKGIEHQDEFLYLQRERCDSGQGFLFGRSFDVAGIGELLNTWALRASGAVITGV
jgi:EAL domain-containing protein (putative c-di-GMP-specific phosphodiesterase class I)/DNA-binding response OmpR family regulator